MLPSVHRCSNHRVAADLEFRRIRGRFRPFHIYMSIACQQALNTRTSKPANYPVHGHLLQTLSTLPGQGPGDRQVVFFHRLRGRPGPPGFPLENLPWLSLPDFSVSLMPSFYRQNGWRLLIGRIGSSRRSGIPFTLLKPTA